MTTVSAGVASPADGLVCFVCDGTVVGRYYNLASCKTQVTKQRIVEKLGLLVGEQYMVVVSEDDIICRSCTTMLNNLDRLEKEMSSVRSVILRFLEKKYELDDGELFQSKIVLPPPTNQPDIMHGDNDYGPLAKKPDMDEDLFQAKVKEHMKDLEKTEEERNLIELSTRAFQKTEGPITFQERKTQSAKALLDSDGKSNVWMQCDRCKYTTPYSSFMINHIHKHSLPVKPEPPSQHTSEAEDNLQNHSQLEIPVSRSAEVSPEVSDNAKDSATPPESGQVQDETETDMSEAVVEMDMGEDNVENGVVCMVDENGMVLQKVQQAEDGQFYVVEGDDDGSKQMLSMAEDGTVQMVQVTWDDIEDAVSVDNQIQF